MMRVLLVLVAATSIAHAEGAKRKALGNGLELIVENNMVYVVRGKVRARLEPGYGIESAKLVGTQVDVILDQLNCDAMATAPSHWQLDQLEARLANAVAYGQHTKKDFKSAEAGFARAAALDPAWPTAAYNLASARQLLGDLDGAVAALAPWLKREPLVTYIQVASDPELAPLLARPELKALQATRRGSVTVDPKGIAGDIAYSPERSAFAVARREASWGACVFMVDVELHDAVTGKLEAKAPLITWDDTRPECAGDGIKPSARGAIAQRAKLAQGVLADLGFSPATIERGSDPRGSDAEKRTSSFPKHKVGVVAKDGVVRALRKDTELGHVTGLEQLIAATYVTELNAIVVTTLRPGREGCEGSDPTEIDLLRLP
jgi:hypothetical protein